MPMILVASILQCQYRQRRHLLVVLGVNKPTILVNGDIGLQREESNCAFGKPGQACEIPEALVVTLPQL